MNKDADGWTSGKEHILLVVLLLVCFTVAAVTSLQKKSVTYDEVAHLTAGYHCWTRHDYRYHPKTAT